MARILANPVASVRTNDAVAVYRSLFYISNPSQQFRLLI